MSKLAPLPARLATTCKRSPSGTEWLRNLPSIIQELTDRWSLSVDAPFDGDDGGHAWVAPVTRADGERLVLKIGLPHMEAEHEIAGLEFWNGEPTVRIHEADESLNAMLLEQCEPGTSLRSEAPAEQDRVIAQLLKRLWRRPTDAQRFRPLAAMLEFWTAETRAASQNWRDASLVNAGLELFKELATPRSTDVLLGTDIHSGNVLRAHREPWLVIDPKPFIGDAAYDATQHLFNCRDRLLSNPTDLIERFADLLSVDAQRLRLWLFARAAAEPREAWDATSDDMARALRV
jgi:streptomycin 6-kinase